MVASRAFRRRDLPTVSREGPSTAQSGDASALAGRAAAPPVETALTPFHQRLLAEELALSSTGAARVASALTTATVDLNPHQIEAAAFALEALPRGGPMRTLCFTVAAWFRYLGGKDDQGRDLPLNEPMADELVKRAKAGREDPTQLLAMRQLFGDVLPKSAPFVNQVKDDLQALYSQGARAALKRALA